MGRPRRAVTALALAAGLLAIPTATAAGREGPAPGAADVGDRLFPGLGNGGYDVLHYDLDLRYASSAPSQPIEGSAIITARATQALSRFNLDFAGGGVAFVAVEGRRAAWIRDGEELVVTPRRALREGRRFVVRVGGFTATPTVPDPEDPTTNAFFVTPHGSATAAQPNYAHRIFPSNDHPSDKATFSFRLDVPAGVVALANGVPAGRSSRGDRAIWRYRLRQPMATQLIQLAVGTYDLSTPGTFPGVLLRDATAPTLTDLMRPILALQPAHLEWMEAAVGRYPFDAYGALVLDVALGFALETQTLSLYDRVWFTELPQGVWDPVMVHELAHMWFGDSVALHEWSDLWLSEGHASWYEFVYAEENDFLEEDTTGYPNEEGYAEFDVLMEAVYALGDQWRAQYGPVARPLSKDVLFSLNVYHGGALVLYALREEIGERAYERLERSWARRYAGKSASTADFIAHASQIAGRDLRPFLRAWLYDTTTPPMPGHPEWEVLPVEAPARAAATALRPPRR